MYVQKATLTITATIAGVNRPLTPDELTTLTTFDRVTIQSIESAEPESNVEWVE